MTMRRGRLNNTKDVCVCVCVYVYTCTYVYTHTHTHTHTVRRGGRGEESRVARERERERERFYVGMERPLNQCSKCTTNKRYTVDFQRGERERERENSVWARHVHTRPADCSKMY